MVETQGNSLQNIVHRQPQNAATRGVINPINAELNPVCHLLALLGAQHFLHISRIRVKDQECAWWPRKDGTEIKTRSCGYTREGAKLTARWMAMVQPTTSSHDPLPCLYNKMVQG
jgi:hypothetical protein